MTSAAVMSATLAALVVGAVAIASWWAATTRARRLQGRAEEAELRAAAAQTRAAGAEATVEELRRQAEVTGADRSIWQERTLAAERAAAAAHSRAEELTRALGDQKKLVDETAQRMGDTFKALAADALLANSESFRAGFLALAGEKLQATRNAADEDLGKRQLAIETTLAPVRESLGKIDDKIAALEKERQHAYSRLTAQVEGLSATQDRLHNETANLVKALRAPQTRGRWGEIQLRRVVELAGMLEHCDFSQQMTLTSHDPDGGRLRPDLVVRLPGQRYVVVDAKVPLEAYLDATQTDDEAERRRRLVDHAAQVRAHVHKLAAKSYWEQLAGAPEFVVLFLPSDAFFAAAVEVAPSLIEEGVQKKVLIATPTTLIAVLQAVYYGWREERIAENAQAISEQGRALHKAVVTFAEHWSKLGGALGRTLEHYNASVGSLEKRVLPVAQKLGDMGAGSGKELPAQLTLTTRPRLIAALEGGEPPRAAPDAEPEDGFDEERVSLPSGRHA